mmetsp:Transcript_33542/g.72618  ORF Transcript_33542/g.72618 Transcript_33542/m.72618 type:complete len:349 (-) Transcript_33542:16-1062(-)
MLVFNKRAFFSPRSALQAFSQGVGDPQPIELKSINTSLLNASLVYNNPADEVWSKTSVLGSDRNHVCEYTHASFDDTVPLCLRTYGDLVSDVVRNRGDWTECQTIEDVWTSSMLAPFATDGDLFLDIGANIGICSVHMAAATDAKKVVAFEPSPANLFYFTSTLMENPSLRNEIEVRPIGLGDNATNVPIFAEPGNAGHSVLSAAFGEDGKAVPVLTGAVSVARLDDIFQPPYPHIRLVKIDVEGFETKVVQGGWNLFSSGAVKSVFFELSPFLISQHSSRLELINLFRESGFVLKRPHEEEETIEGYELESVVCDSCPHCFANLVAVLPDGKPVVQPPLSADICNSW